MLGQQLSVRVAATKRGYVSGSAASVRTAAVAPGTMASTAAPAVSGTSRVDEVLTVRAGTWSPKPEVHDDPVVRRRQGHLRRDRPPASASDRTCSAR